MLHRTLIGGELRTDRTECLDLDVLTLEVGILVPPTYQGVGDQIDSLLNLRWNGCDASDKVNGPIGPRAGTRKF